MTKISSPPVYIEVDGSVYRFTRKQWFKYVLARSQGQHIALETIAKYVCCLQYCPNYGSNEDWAQMAKDMIDEGRVE